MPQLILVLSGLPSGPETNLPPATRPTTTPSDRKIGLPLVPGAISRPTAR